MSDARNRSRTELSPEDLARLEGDPLPTRDVLTVVGDLGTAPPMDHDFVLETPKETTDETGGPYSE